MIWLATCSLAVVTATVALAVWHLKQWRTVAAEPVEKAEYDYRRHQFRRRFQITLMLGAATAALPFGLPILQRWPKFGSYFWIVLILLYVWAGALALADILAIKLFFGRLRDRNQLEQTRLKAELRRIQNLERELEAERAAGDGHDREEPGKRNGRP